MAIDTPLLMDGSSGSAEWATLSELWNRLSMVSCRLSVGCVSCRARIAILRFFIRLFMEPHLSCGWLPSPFMLSEANISCFRCLRGWCRPSAGSFLRRWAVPDGIDVRGPVSRSFDNAASYRVDWTLWLRRVCLLPPSWQFPAGSRLPWTFRPSTSMGGLILFLIPAVLGCVSPGSVSGGFERYGSAKPPS